jgi:hypothetical protein
VQPAEHDAFTAWLSQQLATGWQPAHSIVSTISNSLLEMQDGPAYLINQCHEADHQPDGCLLPLSSTNNEHTSTTATHVRLHMRRQHRSDRPTKPTSTLCYQTPNTKHKTQSTKLLQAQLATGTLTTCKQKPVQNRQELVLAPCTNLH